jgi:hypothetical protein
VSRCHFKDSEGIVPLPEDDLIPAVAYLRMSEVLQAVRQRLNGKGQAELTAHDEDEVPKPKRGK